jgi:hypothetical protein
MATLTTNDFIALPYGTTIWDDSEYPQGILYLGKPLRAIGCGQYPYDCDAKRKYPDAMIYQGDGCWHLLHR